MISTHAGALPTSFQCLSVPEVENLLPKICLIQTSNIVKLKPAFGTPDGAIMQQTKHRPAPLGHILLV
jgi:hypothetical protein